MGIDGQSAENVSHQLVLIAQGWTGSPVVLDPNTGEPEGIDWNDDYSPKTSEKGPSGQDETVYYTSTQIAAALNWLAKLEQGASGDQLKKYQTIASAWTNEGSQMNNFADTQKAPFNSLQQGEASAIQSDQSSQNGAAGLATGITGVDSIVSELIPGVSA